MLNLGTQADKIGIQQVKMGVFIALCDYFKAGPSLLDRVNKLRYSRVQ